jgi:hypothetical protein
MTDEEIKIKKERIAKNRVKLCKKRNIDDYCWSCCGKENCEKYKNYEFKRYMREDV